MSTHPRGFIALMSAVIIAAILLLVVVGGGMLGFFTRFDALDAENKEHSAALVDACADTIATSLAADSTYSGPTTVSVGTGGDKCTVLGSSTSGSTRTFKVQAVYDNAYTNALISYDIGSASLVSWQEVGNL